jgi:hypothetical protein
MKRTLPQIMKFKPIINRLIRFPFRPGSVATIAFAAVAVGLWWERPSLALIIPGAVVFGCLTWSHLRGTNPNA